MSILKRCSAAFIVVAILILLYCDMKNATIRSLHKIITISADVNGTYTIIGSNENMMDDIQTIVMLENSNADIERFCDRWNMSKEEYALFSTEFDEYCIIEVMVELDNDSDVYLHGISIACNIQNSFVADDGFLFCDGPKLPAHQRALSESPTFILLKKDALSALKDTADRCELKLYCYGHPEGVRYDDIDIKIRLFQKVD